MPSSTPPAPDIVLHIGAHKTATTHLQQSMLAVRGALARQGVQVYGPSHLRGRGATLMARFGIGAHSPVSSPVADHADALAAMVKGADRLVLSEENFIGTIFDRTGLIPAPIYPRAAKRIGALAARIAPQGIHVCLAIRRPTSFLSSAFGQVLLGGTILTAAQFRKMNPPDRIDWSNLIGRISHSQGTAHVTVWRFEDYAQLFPSICEALLGGKAAKLVAPVAKVVHQGLSASAHAAIRDWHAAGHTGPLAALARETYPVTAADPRWEIFNADEQAQSDARYIDQVARIAAMPGVTFLRP